MTPGPTDSRPSSSAGWDERAPRTVFLGLGSNLGDRVEHLAVALRALGDLGEIRGASGVYETAPEGFPDQPPFLNMAVRIETVLEPVELLECTRRIERDRGRVRTFRNAPRTLDIDVLLFGDRILDLDGLAIPHPRMSDRAFVLVPLLELAPGLTDPRTGRPFRESLAELRRAGGDPEGGDPDPPDVRRVMDGEELLDVEKD